MKQVTGTYLLRALKLFVLVGFPVLGFVYAYQYTGQEREVIVPFKTFQAPHVKVAAAGMAAQKVDIPLRTPITAVNFWATWCPPCVEEFPAMIELQRQLKGKGVDIVFVSVDDSWDNVLKFLKTNNVPFDPEHMFWDPTKEAAQVWGSVKFPETYVVRRDAWVVEKIIGAQQWTRPVVIKYFKDLGQKFGDIRQAAANSLDRTGKQLTQWVVPSALAAGAEAPGQPLIHEEDKKTLAKMRENIEIATQNLQKAQAALREEERNLKEQKIVFERRKKEQSQSESDLQNIQGKMSEVQSSVSKTQDSIKTEQSEKKKVEGQIKEIQQRIADLQKKLEAAKDELTQANKALNTRVQSLETLQKSLESSEDESKSLKAKVDKAKGLVNDRKKGSDQAEEEIRAREKKVSEIRGQVSKAEATLKEQKAKLEEFERLLKK